MGFLKFLTGCFGVIFILSFMWFVAFGFFVVMGYNLPLILMILIPLVALILGIWMIWYGFFS